MASEDKASFRLRNKDDPTGSLSPAKFLRASLRHGEFQLMWLLPHFVLPVYGVYRLVYSAGMYPAQLEPLAALILAIVQGACIGGIFTFGFLRFSKPGRRLQGRIDAGAATPGETKAQRKIQLGFALCGYTLFVTCLWLLLPPADGPNTAAVKQTVRRYGFDPNRIPGLRS
ncbi:unnamed protein product [Parajaminaea phylloscopi]